MALVVQSGNNVDIPLTLANILLNGEGIIRTVTSGGAAIASEQSEEAKSLALQDAAAQFAGRNLATATAFIIKSEIQAAEVATAQTNRTVGEEKIRTHYPTFDEGSFAESVKSSAKSMHKWIIDDIPYSPIRGILAPKRSSTSSPYPENEALKFQFNPEEIIDIKNSEWATKSYTGYSANDYFWIKGGERQISFKLFFDATAGSNNQMFEGRGDYGIENLNPRGVLPMVEKLTKFQYPVPEKGRALFLSGGLADVSAFKRFSSPPIAIFVFGSYYMEAVVPSVNVKYTLFNKDLVPVRAECDVTLKIIESYVVDIDTSLQLLSNDQKTKSQQVTTNQGFVEI